MVRTGIEDGLSAPVTFGTIADKTDSYSKESQSVIKTNLATAVDFFMELEQRERAAFGPQPDTAVDFDVRDNYLRDWQKQREDELLVGPSSQWVDIEKYPQWTGPGEHYDSFIMAGYEKRRFDVKRRGGEEGSAEWLYLSGTDWQVVSTKVNSATG